MSTTAEVKELVKTAPKATTLQEMIQKSVTELGRALPSHLSPERLVRIALTTIRLNPELSSCTPDSFLGSLFVLAQLGLEPVAGRAYLLPFNNKRKVNGEWKSVKEVQAVIGYKGLIDLFYRHGAAVTIDMQTVHKGDDFAYQYGTEAFLKHTPAMSDRGEVIGYYSVAKIKGGGNVFFFMSRADAMEHGQKHSKTFDKTAGKFYDSSPWAKEPDAMCMKSTLIQLAKRLPLAVELQRALEADETSRDYRQGIDNALDITPTTNWESEAAPEAAKPQETKPEPQEPEGGDLLEGVTVSAIDSKLVNGTETFYVKTGRNVSLTVDKKTVKKLETWRDAQTKLRITRNKVVNDFWLESVEPVA